MLEIGSLVDGKYKILRVVGKGGMSVVYQAVNERANKIWAIKEVRKDGVQNFEVVKQNLIVETDLLKRFNHPNLPSIIDVIDGDGSFLIVMDYIEGNSLSKALESGAQSQEDVIEWSKQLCDVLGYLHSRKPPIIYRDMKPSNVMLKPDGNVSLIDFGTAREFKSSSVEDTTCLGTQGYAAPEQYGGHGQTDARTDIYCLGATMYHLVTGHNPSTPPYEMYPIRQWNPNLSSGLEEIILKCTQRNPDDRYQSCAELLYALDHYRDLDIENKKVQTLKWRTFLISLVMTVVAFVSTISFSVIGNSMAASTYDSLITQGKNQQEKSLFMDAIKMEPDNIQGYIELLNYFVDNDEKSDNVLEHSEYEQIIGLEGANEAALVAKDKDKFADEFALKMADSLFFVHSKNGIDLDTDGITYSFKWFEKVTKYSSNRDNLEHARILEVLSKNYSMEESITGEDNIDIAEYWGALKQLSSSELISDETYIKVPLMCYRFVASELYNRNDVFQSKGISEKEYMKMLDSLAQNVEKIKSFRKYQEKTETYRIFTDTIDECIKSAKEYGYGNSLTDKTEGVSD